MSHIMTYCSRCGKRNDLRTWPESTTALHFCTCPPEPAIAHEYDPSRELVTIPKGSSIFPRIDYDALWQIAQAVAERDSTFFESDAPIENWQCPFCNGGQTFHSHARKEPFPHQPDCIVTKACALIEQRKQMPQITVKLAVDGKIKEAGV